MKLTTKEVSVSTFKDTLSMLLPRFGKQAVLDVPRFDFQTGLYLVNQWTSELGNRYLTYVGISKEIIIEVQVGLHYAAKYLDWVMVGKTEDFSLIVSIAYIETHFSIDFLKSDLKSRLAEFVVRNHTADDTPEADVNAHVLDIISEIFNHKPADLDKRGLRPILLDYCKSRNFCKDFTDRFYNY